MNFALQLCLLSMIVAASAEASRYDVSDEVYEKRAALADFRKRFDGWGPEEPAEQRHHPREKDSLTEHETEDKRAALADFKRAALADFKRASLADFKRAALADFKRAALADFKKRAALADFKRAALADFKRAALADFKRAALADFKRAALADFKRAALADFKRSEKPHHEEAEGHEKTQHHRQGKSGNKHETKRTYYWDICTREVEKGQEEYYACKKRL